MTPSELKQKVEATGNNPYFFTRDTMRFFGDRMSNYGCRQATYKGVRCWELWRKRPVKHGLKSSHYFNMNTFERVI